MFTGIIQKNAQLKSISKNAKNLRVSFSRPSGWKLKKGESISINGVCSTVKSVSKVGWKVEYMPETRRLTTVNFLNVGDSVNLERSLSPASLLGGHLVQGHVDGVGKIKSIEKKGSAKIFTITVPLEIDKYIVKKGSVTVHGVSLTVVDTKKSSFRVSLVSYTLAHTNLGSSKVGDNVNIEVDIIAKYVSKMLKRKKNATKKNKNKES